MLKLNFYLRRLVSLFLFFMLTCTVHAKEFLIVGEPGPLWKYENNGKMEGIDIDIVRAIMNEIGITYRIRLVGATARGDKMAKDGTADMLIAKAFKEERKEYLVYPKESYRKAVWKFFIRKEDEGRIKFENYSDLKNLKVGATKYYAYSKEFWDAGLKMDIVTRNDYQMKKLLAKRFDLVPLLVVNTLQKAKSGGFENKISILPKPVATLLLYNTFTVKSTYPNKEKLQAKYDRVARKLKNNGTIQMIMEQYLTKFGLDPKMASNIYNE